MNSDIMKELVNVTVERDKLRDSHTELLKALECLALAFMPIDRWEGQPLRIIADSAITKARALC